MKKFFIKIPLQDWLDEMSPRLPGGEQLFKYDDKLDKMEYVGDFQRLSSDLNSYVVVQTPKKETFILPVRNLCIEVEVYFNPELNNEFKTFLSETTI